jgi:TRAP-type C4-dicarboxylate transport system permease large subunit
VLYGIMTETDIAKLFFAGIAPGLLAIAMYSVGTHSAARLPCMEYVPKEDAKMMI